MAKQFITNQQPESLSGRELFAKLRYNNVAFRLDNDDFKVCRESDMHIIGYAKLGIHIKPKDKESDDVASSFCSECGDKLLIAGAGLCSVCYQYEHLEETLKALESGLNE